MKNTFTKQLLSITTVVLLTFNGFSQTVESTYLGPYIPEEVGNGANELLDNNAVYNKSGDPCPLSSEGTIGLVECADIGTAAFSTAAVQGPFDSESGNSGPLASGCTTYSNGSWHQYDLAAGIDQILVNYVGGFAGAGGFKFLFMSFYQGPDCSSLTEVGCGQIINFSTGTLQLLPLSISGLDPTQPLWVYTSGNKNYNIDLSLVGTGPVPVNDDCPSATNSNNGCNLGATGAAFTPPSAAGAPCTGGTWYSNENTVFYTFTATSTSGTIDVQNLTCNDGISGEAQVAVWTDCGSVGTYGANFIGCAVGSGSLSMPALTIGQSYIIAVDGQAGDACTWDFVTTGIALPVELEKFSAKYIPENRNVEISWITVTEINNDYFTIEKTTDGITFEVVEIVDGNGNTQMVSDYGMIDTNPSKGTSYYRLAQTDFDGEVVYSKSVVVIVESSFGDLRIFPNPVTENSYMSYVSDIKEESKLDIVDLSGNIISSQIVFSEIGNNEIELQTKNLNNGVYFVKVSNSKEILVTKFVKQ